MNNNMNKKPLFDRRGKSGTYAVVVSLILLAVLIVVNMIVSSLPSKLTMLDTSAAGQYDISGTSESFVASVKEKITVYFICSDGNEDTSFETFIDRYASMNSNISVVDIDPVNDPTFLEKYQADGISENSLIIESEKRVKVIDYYDFFLFTNADLGYTMTYDEYAQYGAMYEQYYGYSFTPVQYFDSVLTLGIEYVIADKVPSMYVLNGHGEAEFADIVKQYLDYFGMKYESLNLALGDAIPDDCTCLLVNAPATDITATEAATISSYLENGGNMLLITSNGADKFANLSALAAEFGLAPEAGTVNEGDSSAHVPNVAGHIYPTVNDSHEATSYLSGNNVSLVLSYTHAITVSEKDGVDAEALFTTTDQAYSVVNGTNGEAGVKNLAVVAEKDGGKLCWIASGGFITDSLISLTNGGNFEAFYVITSWLTGNYTSSLPDIPGIELSEPIISTTATDANVWGTILIFVIPLAVLGTGIGYSVYRKRR